MNGIALLLLKAMESVRRMTKQPSEQFINSIYSLADEYRYDEKPDDLRACLEMICEMIVQHMEKGSKKRKRKSFLAAKARWDKERPIKFVIVDE